jgi:hypothetical protein
MAYASLSLGDVHTNAKGAKMAQLTDAGEKCFYTFPEATKAPFGPNNFDKDASAPRQNLEIRVTGEAASYFRGLDAWAEDYICAHSERLFKKRLSLQQVRDIYHPCLREAANYDPLLRCKINMPGSRAACRYWTAHGEEREAPTDWRDAEVKPHVQISHMWLMGGSCGLVVNVTDLLVSEASRAFPFARNDTMEE